jgi:uncharacterized protein YggE
MATKTKMTTGPKKAVTPASKAAATDKMKKASAVKCGPGVKLAKPGQSKANNGNDMRAEQLKAAKAKAEVYKAKHGVYPTPENVKRSGKM